MALALMGSSRLWIAGVVSPRRDKQLIMHLVEQIRAMAQFRPLLFAVDGLATYVSAFCHWLRLPVRSSATGRWHLEAWPQVTIVHVSKSSARRTKSGTHGR